MRPKSKRRRGFRPEKIKVGSAEALIYSDTYSKPIASGRRRYQRFTVVHYRLDGEKRTRVRQYFNSVEDARLEARRIATALARGEADAANLTSAQRSEYVHAKQTLGRFKEMPLHVAIQEFVAAKRHAGHGLIQAAQEYAQRHAAAPVHKSVAEAVKEFIAAKEQDKMSTRYLQTLRSHLNRFSQHFQAPILTVTWTQIDAWLRRGKLGPRTRNNILGSVVSLFQFAKDHCYLPQSLPTEVEDRPRAKDLGGEIGILRPEQLAKLLTAGDEETRLYLALGAFSALRREEILRLHWGEVRFEIEKIEVAKSKAKTASRRLAPIPPNLMRWLAPYQGSTGRIFATRRAADRVIAFAKATGVEWPNNCLRHSYATYRMAQCHDAGRVSDEMGNSAAMVYRNYRELVDPRDAVAWFNIVPPDAAENVVHMESARKR